MSSSPVNTAPAWVSARHLQHIVSRGEAAGLAMSSFLVEAGIGPALLADPDGQVPMVAVEALLAALAQRHGQPFGLRLAQDIQPATFGVLGYITQACSTLGDVLETVVRYNGLLSNIGHTSLRFAPGTVEVIWECRAGGEAFRHQATDYVLGSLVVLARLLLSGQDDLLRAVNFSHARPADAAHVREYAEFFRAPVYFSQPQASVLLTVTALRRKLPHGDAALRELMEVHALQLLRQRTRESSLMDAVRHLVEVMIMDGVPTKEAVAQQLGMSERSLHRHLQEQGTSYRDILDTARLQMAHRCLCQTQESVNHIATLLGFSTHQAFLRWFRQCTGVTPGVYRQQHSSSPEKSS